MKRKQNQGFTLLELLMVVIIIAILASIALPQYMRVAERSRASEALTVLAAIRSSELRFRAQNPANQYTTVLNSIDVEIPGYSGVPASSLFNYIVTGNAATSNALATRLSGAGFIHLDLDSGNSCSNNPVYGLTVGNAC